MKNWVYSAAFQFRGEIQLESRLRDDFARYRERSNILGTELACPVRRKGKVLS